jgi:hypothetical protein
VENHKIPSKGDQVEQRRLGISRIGYVWYSDQLQVLVKWQDGKSSSLRIGRDQFSIQPATNEDSRSLTESTEPAPTRSAHNDSDKKPAGRTTAPETPAPRTQGSRRQAHHLYRNTPASDPRRQATKPGGTRRTAE